MMSWCGVVRLVGDRCTLTTQRLAGSALMSSMSSASLWRGLSPSLSTIKVAVAVVAVVCSKESSLKFERRHVFMTWLAFEQRACQSRHSKLPMQ